MFRFKLGTSEVDGDVTTIRPEDEVTRVYGCATMWHESTEEMGEMIKSIFRMDEDWSARYIDYTSSAAKSFVDILVYRQIPRQEDP